MPFEMQPPPSTVTVVINDGSAQRSRITSVTVNFDQTVTLPANPADAFRQRGNRTIAREPSAAV